MINSRAKGVRGEWEVGQILTAADLQFVREQSGRTQGADFRFEQFFLEARYRQKLEIPKWCIETEVACPPHLVPALAWRKNGQPWRISQRLDDWAELVKVAVS